MVKVKAQQNMPWWYLMHSWIASNFSH